MSSQNPPSKRLSPQIRMLRSGRRSLRAVASALNKSGYHTRRGTEWRRGSVVRAINQDVA